MEVTKMKTSEPRTAYTTAVRQLAMRAMSKAELYEKLVRQGYPAEEADDAVAAVTERGYIDEDAYARSLVKRYAKRGYGRRAVFARLRAHGLDAKVIEPALEELEYDEDMLVKLALKYLKGETGAEAVRRAGAALYRRGYTPEQIKTALRNAGTETDE